MGVSFFSMSCFRVRSSDSSEIKSIAQRMQGDSAHRGGQERLWELQLGYAFMLAF